jgi:hypothetical protein
MWPAMLFAGFVPCGVSDMLSVWSSTMSMSGGVQLPPSLPPSPNEPLPLPDAPLLPPDPAPLLPPLPPLLPPLPLPPSAVKPLLLFDDPQP